MALRRPAIKPTTAPATWAIDREGMLYVTDRGSQTIRTVAANGAVSTFAGSGAKGATDGAAPDATFNNPIAIAADPDGNVVIADTDNHSIRTTKPTATGPGGGGQCGSRARPSPGASSHPLAYLAPSPRTTKPPGRPVTG